MIIYKLKEPFKIVVQENSDQIEYEFCLIGMCFYLGLNDGQFTQDSINNWKQVIEKHHGKHVDEYDSEQVTHVICSYRTGDLYFKAVKENKRMCTIYWLEDVLEEKCVRAPWLAYHFPCAFLTTNNQTNNNNDGGPLEKHIVSSHGFSIKEKLIIKTMIWLLGGIYTSTLSNINSILISKVNDNRQQQQQFTSVKMDRAKKWNIQILNGCWLMELYLGNKFALAANHSTKQNHHAAQLLDARYTNLSMQNHFSFDRLLVDEFLAVWQKTPIHVPLNLIQNVKYNKLNASNQPLKQLDNNNMMTSCLKRQNQEEGDNDADANSDLTAENTHSTAKMLKK